MIREVIVLLLLLRRLVKPKGIRWELLGIDTFGQKCVNAEQREVVELKLGSTNGNKVISLEAIVVPKFVVCKIAMLS